MDRFLARLERRFGKLAIENLPTFIVGGMGIVFLLSMARPEFLALLDLDTRAVAHGQVWRLVTYLFIPQATSLFWILFSLYWVYWIGSSLEAEWGSFKLNVYYLIGMLGTTLAAFITGMPQANTYLNYSLLFAFATLFPDYEIRLFLILPIRMKWLGWLTFAFVAYEFVQGDWGVKGAVVAALANYLLFFSGHIVRAVRGGRLQAQQAARRASSAPPPAAAKTARVCAICGANEADGADIRVCSCEKCGGRPRELCLKHAREH
jgi:membrane associated rhomboid family serine protease